MQTFCHNSEDASVLCYVPG